MSSSSLKQAYYEGLTGLHQITNNAFTAGSALVGSSVPEVTDLDLGNVNGAALATGSTGKYFDISAVATNYRVWFQVSVETAPSAAGKTLLQVNVLSGDTAAQVASKLAAAVNLLTGVPFGAVNTQTVVEFTGTASGPGLLAPSIGTMAGTAYMTVVVAGVAANGQFAVLQAALTANAALGLSTFTVIVPVTYNPAALRGNNGNNLIQKAYFAGIEYGLATQQVYNYECNLTLNTTDTVTTSVNFNFTFV